MSGDPDREGIGLLIGFGLLALIVLAFIAADLYLDAPYHMERMSR